MATTKTNKSKSTRKKKDMKGLILKSYREYVLTKGHAPASVFQFMRELNQEEGDFYTYFASFGALEKHLWRSYIDETIETLHGDSAYADYSAREKMLAFYFTLFELLKNDRSYVTYSLGHIRNPEIMPNVLKLFRAEFMDFVSDLLNQGREQEEVIDRPVISNRYKDGIWLQMMFLLRFWLEDDTTGFAGTDAAIEKSVNLSFELMGRGPLDQMIDFVKFLYHNKKV